ncbi:hypothetical protein T11_2149 [Trichinella zimbabwensis]|uniref:Uncharacterized protein n=1 Tax=Trichinella zimbabwensis TaxID=268475 RepID=A0A0V1GP79_9BILA|nr:hypothetical protein T11_2149 [Trichinella zimbabwensis]
MILFKGLTTLLPLSRNELELKHCRHILRPLMAIYNEKCVEYVYNTKEIYFLHYTGLASRLTLARSERELKHCFHIVSWQKAVFNESAVEFVPREKKTKRAIPVKRNNMFSVLPDGVGMTMRSQRECKNAFTLHLHLSSLKLPMQSVQI